ncbi:hypothetical protein SAMN04488078_11433 [Antarctobacter heliothermus]|uniref:Lipoprotein n=1 Tax=Antarctobacter heliothermus TaxID=74033 RepID=A0A239MEF6_9RHOB|nr:hypothetical protein SAMN04488078_11433 [Antarctobacter heliothermus]
MQRLIWAMIPMCFATGCAPVAVSEPALCAELDEPTRAHAAALAEDAGTQPVVSGAHLIRLIDAGCGRPR